MSRRQSYIRALRAVGFLDSNDGAFSMWKLRLGGHDIGCHLDEQFGLQWKTGPMKEKSAAEQGSETTTTNKKTKYNFSFVSCHAVKLSYTHEALMRLYNN
jgi:hypothetical protein